METVIRLKANPDLTIRFVGCFPHYDAETREVVIYNLEQELQAVYDADVLVGEVIWRW